MMNPLYQVEALVRPGSPEWVDVGPPSTGFGAVTIGCIAQSQEPGTQMESPVNDHRQPDLTIASTRRGDGGRREQVAQFLNAHGANEIVHLNGSLFHHLERTELLLRRWGCSEAVAIAGLCHAAYGTDGFPTALVTLEDRDVLYGVAGPDVEGLVYLYASCDRAFVYPKLRDNGRVEFRDRFTGRIFKPAENELQGFVDLTLANEFDVGLVGPNADVPPQWLLAMFSDFQHLASAPVRDGFQLLITAAGR
jgi:hypothetical protein